MPLWAAAILVLSPRAGTSDEVFVEVLGGGVWNAKSDLVLELERGAGFSFAVVYETRPLDDPLYYAARLRWRLPRYSWELQFLHHKLYLKNPPPEIQHFEITHGLNLLTLNHVREDLPVIVRVGLGFVMPHVTATIRGARIESTGGIAGTGYRLTGPAAVLGAGRRVRLTARLHLVVDGTVTAARTRVRVGSMRVEAPAVALHLQAGLGWRIGS